MDYFNKDEREKQQAFAARRDRIFSPIINGLVALGATPNQVTGVGVAFLMVACLLPNSLAVASATCIALYVFCDGLDGPLARRSGNAHPGGSLVDIVADQLGVVFLSAAAVHHLNAWGPAMVVFACSDLIFIGLVVYANALEVKLRKFIRAKYIFFLLYLGSLSLSRDLVTYFCAGFSVYYSVEAFEALYRIYNHHSGKPGPQADPR
ncbi:MAG: CDP-alcohol phosphatidyltransferase family protein [Desulfovibrio sp.]